MQHDGQHSIRGMRWRVAVARLTAAGSAVCAALSFTNHAANAQTAQPEGSSRAATAQPRPSRTDSGRAPLGEHALWPSSPYRSPGLAVALSLTPLPVDFGNLYAENLVWGFAYSAAEVSLLAPMMWFTGGHMSHDGDDRRSWSDGERNAMIGLVTGYVVVKIGAGIHAGYAARDFNRRGGDLGYATVVPLRRGAALQLGSRF